MSTSREESAPGRGKKATASTSAMRRKLLRIFAVVAGLVVAVAVVALLYLRFGNLDRHRPTVERLASEAVGRELTISGGFDASIGLSSSVLARDVRLANAPWSAEPVMVAVDEVSLRLRTLSLLFPPVQLEKVEMTGARVLVETGPDGESNWDLGNGDADTGDDSPATLSVGGAVLRDVELVVRNPGAAEHRLEVTTLSVASAPEDMLVFELEGALDGLSIDLDGHIGPLAGLIQGAELAADLRGRLGPAEVEATGNIPDLATLAGAELNVDAVGDDLATMTEALHLPFLGDGAFRVTAGITPAGRVFDVAVDAGLADLEATIRGRLDSLVEPGELDLTVNASGPDAAAAAALAGVGGLPGDPFSVSGRVRWSGFPVTMDEAEITVGDTRVSADGVLGAPPLFLDTDFTLEAAGPDLAWVDELAGIELPAGAFRVDARLLRQEDRFTVERLSGRLAGAEIIASGTVGDPPGFAGTDLEVDARGPDLSLLAGLTGVDLPAEPFTVRGRLRQADDGVALEAVQATLGDHRAVVSGRVVFDDDLAGSDLRLAVSGPDLAHLATIAGLAGVPAEPYRAEGTVRLGRGSLRLDGVETEVAGMRARADGAIVPRPGLAGTDLRIHVEGPDLGRAAAVAGVGELPAEPFHVAGRLRIDGDGYELESVEAGVGEVEATAEGRVGALPRLEGSEVRFAASGPHLSDLAPYLDGVTLPDRPFALAGGMRGDRDSVELVGVTVEVGSTLLGLAGTLVPSPDLAGTAVDVEFEAPDTDELGRLLTEAGLVTLPALPRNRFAVTGKVRVDASGYTVEGVDVVAGIGTAHVAGRIGAGPDLVGTDLTVDLDGPDASIIASLLGFEVPMAPFAVQGRVERLQEGARFDNVAVRLGEHHARVHGFLGEPPTFAGTDLDAAAEGPTMALIGGLLDMEDLPDEPFAVAGHFDGTPERFEVDDVKGRIGGSDVKGWIRMVLEGKPTVVAELTSRRLDLAPFMSPPGSAEKPQDEEGVAPRSDRVIPDTPLELDILHQVDADIRWSVAELEVPRGWFDDVQLGLGLHDGQLRLERLTATGQYGGYFDAALAIEPFEEGHRFTARLRLEESRLDLSSADDDPDQWPTVTIDLDLAATGRTVHEIAASANGSLELSLGEGVIDNNLAELLAAGIMAELLSALNPFAKSETSSRLECVVAIVNIADGVAVLDPLAVRTDKMTIVGSGSVDLATENLDLAWITKPRKGLGLSASTLTNPYIKLGGTLSEPGLEMKPLEAAATTGVAVATAGLSLLGKGLWDRITSDRKVCKRALKRAAKQKEARR